MNILYVFPWTDETFRHPMRAVDKPLHQTRPWPPDLPPPGFCLRVALARPSSIWNTWSAPRTATLPMCMPCVRVPVRTLLRIPGIRAGGGDVEAQSDRTSRSEPMRGWTETNGPIGARSAYNCIPCVYVE